MESLQVDIMTCMVYYGIRFDLGRIEYMLSTLHDATIQFGLPAELKR
jgi:hypothetical protein